MNSASVVRSARTWLPALPVLLFLAVFFAAPVLEILLGSLKSSSGQFGLEQYERLASNAVYTKVLWTTFRIAFLTAAICLVIGYPVAYLLSQLGQGGRGRWLVWVLIPFWTSYLVKTFAWILLLSKTGVLGSLVVGLGIASEAQAITPSLTAVLIGMVHGMLPLAVMTMLPIMQGINAQLSQAAQTLGANRPIAFFSVFLPLSAPGIAAAGLLVFITSLGFFIVPALLGTPRETMIAQLVLTAVLDLLNMPFAGALSTILLACAVVVFLLYDRLVGLSSLSGDSTSAPRGRGLAAIMGVLVSTGRLFGHVAGFLGRLTTRRAGPLYTGLKVYSFAVVALLTLPIAIILPIAFTDSQFLSFPPRGFSLRWFETFLYSPIWQAALMRSFGVATVTALLSVAMGLGAALALTRLSPPWAKSLFVFLIAPLIVPRIAIAVGLFYLFARLGLVGTDLGLVIGHTVLAIPYVLVTLAAALKSFDWRLDDAARILGASAFARLRTVLLPLIAPSVASAFLFAFLTSFDDLTIAIFVSSGLKTTLPKQMWDDMSLQVNPTLAAVSTLLVLGIAIVVLVLSSVRRNKPS